jgi:hypothetical protein
VRAFRGAQKRPRVSAAAKRRIEVAAAGDGREELERLVEQYRLVAGGH